MTPEELNIQNALAKLPPAPAINNKLIKPGAPYLGIARTLGNVLHGWYKSTEWNGSAWVPVNGIDPAALSTVRDSVGWARIQAEKNTPFFRQELAKYNAGQPYSPAFVGFFARLNAYFEQGQAQPGKLTASLAAAASQQWSQDAAPSKTWAALDKLAAVGVLATFAYAAYTIATASGPGSVSAGSTPQAAAASSTAPVSSSAAVTGGAVPSGTVTAAGVAETAGTALSTGAGVLTSAAALKQAIDPKKPSAPVAPTGPGVKTDTNPIPALIGAGLLLTSIIFLR